METIADLIIFMNDYKKSQRIIDILGEEDSIVENRICMISRLVSWIRSYRKIRGRRGLDVSRRFGWQRELIEFIVNDREMTYFFKYNEEGETVNFRDDLSPETVASICEYVELNLREKLMT